MANITTCISDSLLKHIVHTIICVLSIGSDINSSKYTQVYTVADLKRNSHNSVSNLHDSVSNLHGSDINSSKSTQVYTIVYVRTHLPYS